MTKTGKTRVIQYKIKPGEDFFQEVNMIGKISIVLSLIIFGISAVASAQTKVNIRFKPGTTMGN